MWNKATFASLQLDFDRCFFLIWCCFTEELQGGNAVLMHTSPESEVFAPDLLGHQLVGSKSLRTRHLLV